ncbi:helix-turn-helix domain-containing protein [Streptomyces griseus]|uniref:helix-turn-helix domain-containing protein n=1 Tax=Streptomyces griseus TaxID=1911 RepID=UPI003649F5DB
MSEQEIKRGPRDPQKRRPRRSDEERAALRTDMAKSYVDDELTIRAVADLYDVSYGHARQLLLDEGVVLRTKRGTRPPAAKKVWKP